MCENAAIPLFSADFIAGEAKLLQKPTDVGHPRTAARLQRRPSKLEVGPRPRTPAVYVAVEIISEEKSVLVVGSFGRKSSLHDVHPTRAS
jgi:hypothetical protein